MDSRRRTGGGFAAAFVCVVLASAAPAQEPPIEVNPNRPTFATPARTTQLGVAELEFGVQQSYLYRGRTAFSSPTLLKLGVATDFEIRISTNGFLDLGAPGAAAASGAADFSLGAQWCFARRALGGADWAVQATHKFATASARRGLGSGEADTTLGLFASRDFGPNHVDVNALYAWLGVPPASGGGHAGQPAGTVSVSHQLTGGWSFGGELYAIGGTPLNDRVVSNLWYVAYQPFGRLVLDTGVDLGLTRGAERVSLFAGLTWGIGRFLRPRSLSRTAPTAW
jgi:hypothetical protein